VRGGLAIEAKVDVVQRSAHCGTETGNEILDLEVWRNHWTASAWRQYLAAGEIESKQGDSSVHAHGPAIGAAQSLYQLSKDR